MVLPERSPRSPRQAARHRPPAEYSRPRLRAAARGRTSGASSRRSASSLDSGGLPTSADTRRAMPHIARCPADTPACTSSPPCSARHPVTEVSAWPLSLCSRRPSAAAGCARLASLAVLAGQHQGRASGAEHPARVEGAGQGQHRASREQGSRGAPPEALRGRRTAIDLCERQLRACLALASGPDRSLVPSNQRRRASGVHERQLRPGRCCDSSAVTLGLANHGGERRILAIRDLGPDGGLRGAARPGGDRRRSSDQWAGQDSNLRASDYESAALTAELPARGSGGRLSAVLTLLLTDARFTGCSCPISAKRKLAAGAAGLAVLAGTGGAYAARSPATRRRRQARPTGRRAEGLPGRRRQAAERHARPARRRDQGRGRGADRRGGRRRQADQGAGRGGEEAARRRRCRCSARVFGGGRRRGGGPGGAGRLRPRRPGVRARLRRSTARRTISG